MNKLSMNKLFSYLVVSLVLFFITPVLSAQAFTGTGTGTTLDPYLVTTCSELQSIATDAIDGQTTDKIYKLSGDIDCGPDSSTSTGALWNDGAGFAPIGTLSFFSNSAPFSGIFNGNNHKITDLYINRPGSDNVGLFGYVSNGTITNVGLDGGSVTGDVYVGGLVSYNSGTITNSYATGAVTGTGGRVGGLVGYNDDTITNSYATGAVTGQDYVGGLVGYTDATITNSYATGAVTGQSYVGGLVGDNFGTITNSYATGAVTGTEIIGGLVGFNEWGTITNSYATGAVTGQSSVGGLVGDNRDTITNSYATGAVTGQSSVGGLVGFNEGGTVTNSYWNTETSGKLTSDGGTGKTSAQMKTEATYTDWDFTDTWSSITVSHYPILKNVTVAPVAQYTVTYTAGTGGSITGTSTQTLWNDESGEMVTAVPATGYIFLKWSDNSTQNPRTVSYPQTNISLTASFSDPRKNISSITELQKIGNDPDYPLIGNYTLTQDIDAAATATWNDGAGFAPIGTQSAPFSGIFNGDNYKITDLYINRPGSDNVGLFGYVSNGTTTNVGLDGGSVTGQYYVGGLVGYNDGTITNSYATGAVTGQDNVGGLVGINGGTITNSYATGAVTGTYDRVGGLVGMNYSTITNSYATGAVTGQGSVGGLVGEGYGAVTNSYWNTETSGQETSVGGTGKTTSEMKTEATYTDWDFIDTWSSVIVSHYPILKNVTVAPVAQYTVTYTAGTGGSITGKPTQALWNDESGEMVTAVPATGYIFLKWSDNSTQNPRTVSYPQTNISLTASFADLRKNISSITELQKIGNDPDYPLIGNYTLTQDIDAAATATWNDGAGFAPIGTQSAPFSGIFNGDNHKITDLYINRPGSDNVGLFGYVSNGTITNVGLDGGSVTGDVYVGGLVSYNSGTITNSYATGAVTGTVGRVGGLVGYNDDTITNSYATGAVIGTGNSVGGLVGNNGGTITNSYATGAVTGQGSVGGLVGEGYGAVTNSYATGAVTGTTGVGGLVGDNYGTITNSYATGAVTGTEFIGGLVGYNDDTITNSYATGAVTGTGDRVGGLVGYNDDTITNSYATGAVTGTGDRVGGLVGMNYSTITNSYATGAVTGQGSVGGLVGMSYGTITNSYWNTETSGQETSAAGTGKTTSEMKTEATYTDWDFIDTWSIAVNEYPKLQVFNTFTLTYTVDANGYLTGASTQVVAAGNSGSAVTAVANSGYRFVKWSDNSVSNPRTDTDITGDLTVSASFELIPVAAPPSSGGGGAVITPPPSTGAGGSDVVAAGVGVTVTVGAIPAAGVNVLTYVTNLNNFTTPESSNGWNSGSHSFQITNLDLATGIAVITFNSNPITLTMKKGESKDLDLDGDGKNDINVTFANLNSNRAEITVKSLALAPSNPVFSTKPPIVVKPVSVELSPIKTTKFVFKKNLSTGMINSDVKELQKWLNANGFILVKTGAGSPGKETTKFGAATRTALIKFQKAKGIKPANGLFGPLTRGVVNR